MTKGDIRRVQADWVGGGARARAAGFDIVYVYGGHTLPAEAVPLAVLQPAHRRVRRLLRKPRAFLAGDARAGAGGGRRRLRDRLPHLPSTRSARRDVELDEGLEFVRWPTIWSTSGTSTSARIAEWSKDSGSSRFFAEGYQLEWTGRVREAHGEADRRRRPADRPRLDARRSCAAAYGI